MVPANAWYLKVPEAERKLGVLMQGFNGIVLLYPLKRITADVAPVVLVLSSSVFCAQCCSDISTIGRPGMCTEFGIEISCVLPSSSLILKFNVPRPDMLNPLVISLYSCPLYSEYEVKWSLFEDIQAEAKEFMPSRKESVSKWIDFGSLTAMEPAKAR